MEQVKSKYNVLLLLAAFIWGLAFVAQSEGIKFVGPLTYNGIRFGLGSLSVLPVILFQSRKRRQAASKLKGALVPGLIAGGALFAVSYFQTAGLADTTVGKAAFITGLYIVFVPLAGIFLKHGSSLKIWLSVGIAAIGLYLLCVKGGFTIGKGDALVFIGAVFCTAQILLVDKYAKKTDAFAFAFTQSAACSLFNLTAALIFESIKFESIMGAAVPIIYGGIFSAGIAFTLQIIGQKHAKPSHAAIIMSMEAVFAALAGWIILNEQMVLKEYIGCALMLGGMIITQIPVRKIPRQSFEIEVTDQEL